MRRLKREMDEYSNLALRFKKLRDELIHLAVDVRSKKYFHLLSLAQRKVEEVRGSLEDEMFADHPHEADIHIFYPGNLDTVSIEKGVCQGKQ